MFGLKLNWTCSKCNTVMNDYVSFVSLYKVNNEDGFVKMICDNCNHIHYINTQNNKTVVDSESINVEKSGICAF